MSDVLRWRGRQFWCYRCRSWVSVPKGESMNGCRREHAKEHSAEVEMFTRPDLLELDAQLEGFYGGTL